MNVTMQRCTTSVALSSVLLVVRNICFPYPVDNLRDVLIDPADGLLHLISNYLVLCRAGVNFEAVTVETPRKRARTRAESSSTLAPSIHHSPAGAPLGHGCSPYHPTSS